MSVSQNELEALILFSLYKFYQNHSNSLELHEVRSLLDVDVSDARVEMAIGSLDYNNYVNTFHPMISGQRKTFKISNEGYKYAEELEAKSSEESDEAERGAAPASDRVVGFDHNEKEYQNVRTEAVALSKQLRTANDTGDLTPRAAEVAASEVDDIVATMDREFFRPAELWRRAKSTLKWIGREAASAAIGAAALSLLALLAALLGFPIGI